MPETTQEPWLVKSMPDLIALARAMEQDAVAGYVALAERMRAESRFDLAAVFDALVAEEEGHLENVDRWRADSGAEIAIPILVPEALFDDEGAGIVAPELLSSYRAFSMAVRNEERAFVFWSYVAAHAPSEDIRLAAERMAKEELGHVATLRRERRLAFHAERRAASKPSKSDLPTLEALLTGHLEITAMASAAPSERLLALAAEARDRAAAMMAVPFVATPLLDSLPEPASGQAVSLSEFLLDCYLDLAEREKEEQPRLRAQAFAGQLIACLQLLRAHPAS